MSRARIAVLRAAQDPVKQPATYDNPRKGHPASARGSFLSAPARLIPARASVSEQPSSAANPDAPMKAKSARTVARIPSASPPVKAPLTFLSSPPTQRSSASPWRAASTRVTECVIMRTSFLPKSALPASRQVVPASMSTLAPDGIGRAAHRRHRHVLGLGALWPGVRRPSRVRPGRRAALEGACRVAISARPACECGRRALEAKPRNLGRSIRGAHERRTPEPGRAGLVRE